MLKRAMRLRCLMAALVILFVCIAPTLTNAALKRGSSGDEVLTVQRKLKQWGYYFGSLDGIFGSRTEAAVRKFQQANGLTVDGVVGKQTAEALGMRLSESSSSSSSSSSQSSGDVYLLARCIYGESRGEPYKGQVAVGAVILNRVKSSKFPNSIAGVIYQSGAFSVVGDGQINLEPNDTALRAAKDAMNGWDPTGGCLYYYNPAKTSNKWMLSLPITLTIGSHVFCRGQ